METLSDDWDDRDDRSLKILPEEKFSVMQSELLYQSMVSS